MIASNTRGGTGDRAPRNVRPDISFPNRTGGRTGQKAQRNVRADVWVPTSSRDRTHVHSPMLTTSRNSHGVIRTRLKLAQSTRGGISTDRNTWNSHERNRDTVSRNPHYYQRV